MGGGGVIFMEGGKPMQEGVIVVGGICNLYHFHRCPDFQKMGCGVMDPDPDPMILIKL